MLEYQVTSAGHYNRAFEAIGGWEGSTDLRWLFYAAWELRVCIERYLFEHLVLLHAQPEALEQYRGIYRVRDLERTIRDIEPEWDEKLRFLAFYLDALGVEAEVPVPDLSALNRLCGRLGNYLHLLRKPEETVESDEWVERFEGTVREAQEHLSSLLRPGQARFELNESGQAIYEAFRDETASREDLRQRIRDEVATAT